jgi:hypothetical protein
MKRAIVALGVLLALLGCEGGQSDSPVAVPAAGSRLIIPLEKTDTTDLRQDREINAMRVRLETLEQRVTELESGTSGS